MNKNILYSIFKLSSEYKYFSNYDNYLYIQFKCKTIAYNNIYDYYIIESPKLYIIVYNSFSADFLAKRCKKRKNCYISSKGITKREIFISYDYINLLISQKRLLLINKILD